MRHVNLLALPLTLKGPNMSSSSEAPLLSRQFGVITRAQARALGLSSKAILSRVRAGQWIKVHRDVFQVASAPLTDLAVTLAATFATGGVASHESAAWLHKLVDAPSCEPTVTVPLARRLRVARVRVHRSTSLEPCTVQGIRVTRPTRSLIDLASALSVEAIEVALDRGLAMGTLTLRRLDFALKQPRAMGVSGTRSLRQLVDSRRGGAPESVLETKCLQVFSRFGLPKPDVQFRVGRYRLDMAYPSRMLAIEIDGLSTHSGRDSWERDMSRQNELEIRGWRFLRFGSDRLNRDPAGVAFDVGRALGLTPRRWG